MRERERIAVSMQIAHIYNFSIDLAMDEVDRKKIDCGRINGIRKTSRIGLRRPLRLTKNQ